MAGHSKWANIKHKKAATDAKRGKIFTRLIREITVAARMGGGDASMNPRLRLAIDKAMDQNMPKDTIERAAKRGSGDLEGVAYEEIRYEGYGIGGAAVIVDCMTDNRTRTVADVRHAFTKHGGNLGTDGSVAFLFKHCGQLVFAPGTDENTLMEAALEAGADDVITNDDGSIEVITAPYAFAAVKEALETAGLKPEFAGDHDEACHRDRADGRRRGAHAEAARRAGGAGRRAGSAYERRPRRVGTRPVAAWIAACPAPDSRHRPRPARHRLRRHHEVGQPLTYVDQRLHQERRRGTAGAPQGDLRGVAEVSARHRPMRGAIEKVFVNVNPQSTLLLGQARGAAIAAAVLRQPAGLRVHRAAGETGGGGHGKAREGTGHAHGANAC